jgi:hypothetical protein
VKKEIRYEVQETELSLGEETVISYGIKCTKKGRTIASVEDISTDRNSVEELARICSKLDLDPSQLKDVAEDFVSG